VSASPESHIPSDLLRSMYGAREKRERTEDAAKCEESLVHFIRSGWDSFKPGQSYVHNWHIEAICEKLQAVSAGEIHRLQIWIPPGTSKTSIVSIFWPAWEWTTRPWLRYWGASYETRFAGRISALSRDLMMSDWYQERWGHMFKFVRDAEGYFSNDRGGTRLATAPESTGSGEHGHRILIDDPINAKEADATSMATLNATNNWYDGTVVTRGLDIGFKHARVLINQRLHPLDLSEHLIDLDGSTRDGGDWEILCLPERYEPSHPFVWPEDPRTQEGELLWPAQRDEKASNSLAASLTPHRAAGQLQQRPAAKEGDLLKVEWWRFYDPRIRSKEEWDQLPKFSMVVMSLDCPQKDKETNDNVAIQAWGIHGVQRYLLDLRKGKMSYPIAKRTAREMAQWARRTWPRARHVILIENTGYGSEMITDLKMELTGVTKINPQQDGDKTMRADAASDSLSSGHCFLPGHGPPWRPPTYEAGDTPADVADFVHELSQFPNSQYDDQCFPAGTLVMRPDGPIAIEDVKAGDSVLSQTGWAVVEHAGSTGEGIVIERFGLRATSRHPFFTQRGWVDFTNIAHDDTLLVCDALRMAAIERQLLAESACAARGTSPNGPSGEDLLSNLHISRRSAISLSHGTKAPREESGTDNTRSKWSSVNTGIGEIVPVYNLKTSDGTYFADGILVHNCDSWSQVINWLRNKQTRPLRTSSATSRKRRSVASR